MFNLMPRKKLEEKKNVFLDLSICTNY